MILTTHAALAAMEAGEMDWEALSARVGRMNVPEVFDAWVENFHDRIDDETFARALTDAWTSPDAPEGHLLAEDWTHYFRLVGFRVNGQPADRQTEPVTLYRGGLSHYRMSWPSTRSVAESFAERSRGSLWSATIPPEVILALIDHERPGEDEYIVDFDGVDNVQQITKGLAA